MGKGLDLLIVGGGLLGLCVAYQAVKRNHRVLLCRLSDAERPQADTLRNQSWLQSGLRYIGPLDEDERTLLAKEMLAGGLDLHDELGIPKPKGFGIVRLGSAAEAEKLERDGARMGVDVVRLDNQAQIRAVLGEFYAPDSIYYATPEIPFDEPMLLRRLREVIRDEGGLVREIPEPVEIIPGEDSAEFTIRLDRQTVCRPRMTVLAAGAGNVPLLESMRLPRRPNLELYQTPLLVVPMTTMRGARIFQDRVRRFSVISHPPSDGIPNGAMVIGTVEGTRTNFCRAPERRIPRGDLDAFWAIDCLRQFQLAGRFTAGFEVAVDGKQSVYPWVSRLSSNLIAAIPGRATMCMRVAKGIANELGSAVSSEGGVNVGTEWVEQIYMHHDPYYGRLNDVAEDT